MNETQTPETAPTPLVDLLPELLPILPVLMRAGPHLTVLLRIAPALQNWNVTVDALAAADLAPPAYRETFRHAVVTSLIRDYGQDVPFWNALIQGLSETPGPSIPPAPPATPMSGRPPVIPAVQTQDEEKESRTRTRTRDLSTTPVDHDFVEDIGRARELIIASGLPVSVLTTRLHPEAVKVGNVLYSIRSGQLERRELEGETREISPSRVRTLIQVLSREIVGLLDEHGNKLPVLTGDQATPLPPTDVPALVNDVMARHLPPPRVQASGYVEDHEQDNPFTQPVQVTPAKLERRQLAESREERMELARKLAREHGGLIPLGEFARGCGMHVNAAHSALRNLPGVENFRGRKFRLTERGRA